MDVSQSPKENMAAPKPLRTYGRPRETDSTQEPRNPAGDTHALEDTNTSSKAATTDTDMLSPNSRVKKLLQDLGESSEEEEDDDLDSMKHLKVAEFRKKYLGKNESATSSPTRDRRVPVKLTELPPSSPLLNTKILDTQIFATKAAPSVTQKENKDMQAEESQETQELGAEEETQELGGGAEETQALEQPVFGGHAGPSLNEETQSINEEGDAFDDTAALAEIRRRRVIVDSDSDSDIKESVSDPSQAVNRKLFVDSDSDMGLDDSDSDVAPHMSYVDSLKQKLASTAEADSFESLLEEDEGVTSSQRPTRKASKKALEEIERETQRINRSRQLAPEIYTTGISTKQSLLARFGGRSDSKPVKVEKYGDHKSDDNDVMDINHDALSPPSSQPHYEEDELSLTGVTDKEKTSSLSETDLVTSADFSFLPKEVVNVENASVVMPMSAPIKADNFGKEVGKDSKEGGNDAGKDISNKDTQSEADTSVFSSMPSSSMPFSMPSSLPQSSPPSSLSRSSQLNPSQVKKLANVGVHRLSSYVAKKTSDLVMSLTDDSLDSDSDGDLVIVPDSEADKIPESFQLLRKQGIPVKFAESRKVKTEEAQESTFYSQIKDSIKKQHMKLQELKDEERVQLGLVDMTEQDKEDEAVESLLDQARRQQMEIADREKRETRKQRQKEQGYESVADSDEWAEWDGGEVSDSLAGSDGEQREGTLAEVQEDSKEELSDYGLSDDGLGGMGLGSPSCGLGDCIDEAAAPTQPELSDDDEVISFTHRSTAPTAARVSVSESESEAEAAPDNSAYLRQLAQDEVNFAAREKARKLNNGIIDGEAEESDDDWAGLGGNSDDERARPEDLAEIGRMVDDSRAGENDGGAANRHYDLQKELDDDAKQVEKLLEDVTNGGLRRRRRDDMDLDFSDSEDEDEMRRKHRLLSERRKKRMLEVGSLEDLAKNPAAAAFLRAMRDEADSDAEIEEQDVFLMPSMASATNSSSTTGAASSIGKGVTAAPTKTLSVRETLSFLCEDSVAEIPSSSPSKRAHMDLSDFSDDDIMMTSIHTRSAIDLTTSRQDTLDDADTQEDYLQRLGPSRTLIVRETEEDQELKTIIGPNGNFHGLIRRKTLAALPSASAGDEHKKKKVTKYLQKQAAGAVKKQGAKERLMAKFRSLGGSRDKSAPSYMRGGSFA